MPQDATPNEDDAARTEDAAVATEEEVETAAAADDTEAEPETEADPLEAAQQEATEFKDRWMRTAAEFDNYRKRTQREMEALSQRATEGVLKELLPILDGVDRALAHRGDGESESDGFREGVQMLMEQLPKVMAERGVQEVEAKGRPFDPNEHEALIQMPSEEFDAGTVAEVVEKGYRLGDRVIRPAKVVVSTGPSAAGAPADEDSKG